MLILDFLNYAFMRRALLAGNLIGVIAPLVGVFLNLRRLSLIGHALSHVALAGVAIGLYAGFFPVYSAILVSVLAALAIEKLRRDYEDYAELSLAIILAAGLGIATILINLSAQTAGIQSYLFGSISLVGRRDIYTIIPLALLIIVIIFKYYYGFFFLAFNENEARLAGVEVRFLNITFMVITSLTIALSIQIVGTLLIASLITIPVATGMLLGKSFKNTIFYSVFFSLLSVNTGIILSFYLDLASGGTIILCSVIFLLMIITGQKFIDFFR
ncbi:MAG: metal ABC transporter permease [Bacillota bacterium]